MTATLAMLTEPRQDVQLNFRAGPAVKGQDEQQKADAAQVQKVEGSVTTMQAILTRPGRTGSRSSRPILP